MEEEGDVTEIYFIIKGEWCVGYNSFATNKSDFIDHNEESENKMPRDMYDRNIIIAQRRVNFGYIGDYYVLASKPS